MRTDLIASRDTNLTRRLLSCCGSYIHYFHFYTLVGGILTQNLTEIHGKSIAPRPVIYNSNP